MSGDNSWQGRTLNRRTALRAAAAVGGGIAGLSIVGCGRKDDQKRNVQGTAGGVVDSESGKQGGKFIFQAAGALATPLVGTKPNPQNTRVASLVHSGLYGFTYGRPPSNGVDVGVEPDLAQALPEQPDSVTYIIKLRPAQFHNGRDVTAEDVQFTFERLASDESTRKSAWLWLDKIDVPDAQTVVLKTKGPFADTIASITADRDAYILAKEFELSPVAATKMMGSGPFTWVEDIAPISTRLKRNPNYYAKPFPYFDEITMLQGVDKEKQIADFTGRQLSLSFWFPEEGRDRLKQARPDAKAWSYPYASNAVVFRVDQPPFNDKRVRQALSMAIDQKKIRDGVSQGEGELDQVFSLALDKRWGFRKPSELGATAKYREFNPQAAKQLLSAAGVTTPIESTFTRIDASFGGQGWYDMVTLTIAGWRELGVANVRDNTISFAQATTSINIGNYDGMYQQPNPMSPVPGFGFKQNFWSPPEGVRAPTLNTGHINDPELSALMEKQLGQLNFEERKQTFRRAEEIMAEQMYRIPWSTYTITYFSDPSLQGAVVPVWAYGYSAHFMKYWWLK